MLTLKELIASRKLNQSQFARILGISRQQAHQFLNDKRKLTPKFARTIGRAFHLRPVHHDGQVGFEEIHKREQS